MVHSVQKRHNYLNSTQKQNNYIVTNLMHSEHEAEGATTKGLWLQRNPLCAQFAWLTSWLCCLVEYFKQCLSFSFYLWFHTRQTAWTQWDECITIDSSPLMFSQIIGKIHSNEIAYQQLCCLSISVLKFDDKTIALSNELTKLILK